MVIVQGSDEIAGRRAPPGRCSLLLKGRRTDVVVADCRYAGEEQERPGALAAVSTFV